MKFAFIRHHLPEYPVTLCCQVLRVSRSSHHAWRKRARSAQRHHHEALAERIRQVHQVHRGVYGIPEAFEAAPS